MRGSEMLGGRGRSQQFVIVIVRDEVDVHPSCPKQPSLSARR